MHKRNICFYIQVAEYKNLTESAFFKNKLLRAYLSELFASMELSLLEWYQVIYFSAYFFRSVFSVDKVQGTDVTLENPFLKATFSGSDGLLKVN